MTVGVSDVRTSLNEIRQKEIPDSVITQGIEYGKLEVERSQNVSEKDYDYAITMWAAHYAFFASPPQTQKEAIDLSGEWDIESFIAHLKERKDRAKERIGESSGGRSAAFMDTASGGKGNDVRTGWYDDDDEDFRSI